MNKKAESQKITTAIIEDLTWGAEFKGRALSNSMAPLIKSGDFVTIKKTPFNNLKKGDVVLFRGIDDEKLRLHRVVKIPKEKRELVTKGDNLDSVDRKVPLTNYLGKAKAVHRFGRELLVEGRAFRAFGFSLYKYLPKWFWVREGIKNLEYWTKKLFLRYLFKFHAAR